MTILNNIKSAIVVSMSLVIACLLMVPLKFPLSKKITFDGPLDVHGRPKEPPVTVVNDELNKEQLKQTPKVEAIRKYPVDPPFQVNRSIAGCFNRSSSMIADLGEDEPLNVHKCSEYKTTICNAPCIIN